ncbi:MAG: hypothetical protein J7L15_08375 [Clostridiales bacterium]|nr:hypothetical protein [Clostridiales bacterium]
MANDIDMWNDIEGLEKENSTLKQNWAKDLMACYNARYQEGDEKLAEKLKDKFEIKWGWWGNYY